MIDQSLFEKYDTSSPRYTSYPPINLWEDNIDEKEWLEQINRSYNINKGIDLYIHIPFCEKLCYYCGCNRIITKNHNVEETYILALLNEWNIYLKKFPDLTIKNIHFGGGTPTFLSPFSFNKILNIFSKNFDPEDFTGSVEIDPRTLKDDHIKNFNKYGLKKASLGIQDFDKNVQKTINREQPFQLVEDVVNRLRSNGFDSVNFDLIYGLPRQTRESILSTIDSVELLSPDTISLFSYAHIPEMLLNQKILDKDPRLEGFDKYNLFESAKTKLINSGYKFFGIDHFSKESDELYRYFDNKDVKRTFMGYVKNRSDIIIGLGSSAISYSGLGYIQNNKVVSEYISDVEGSKISIIRGHTQSFLDTQVNLLIQNLMCYGVVDIFPTLIDYPKNEARDIILNLATPIRDGLISINNGSLKVLSKGEPFLKQLCSYFDYRLNSQTQQSLPS
jgi:oxygen-independent coproporphyrinogen III oxidase